VKPGIFFDVTFAHAAYPAVPRELLEGLGRYFNLRIEPGRFLRAVLSNDLAVAVTHAAPESLSALPQLVRLLLNDAPAYAWGKQDVVLAWCESRTRPPSPAGNIPAREWPTTADGQRAPDYFCMGAPTVEACVEAQRCPRNPVCNE
jgi:hypothetical protein